MERDRLICCLIGWYSALNPEIKAEDLRIDIDEHLIKSKFTPLGTEPNDLELMQELLDETIMSIFGRRINRKMRRAVWHHN